MMKIFFKMQRLIKISPLKQGKHRADATLLWGTPSGMLQNFPLIIFFVWD
jgi:hypothetical protein